MSFARQLAGSALLAVFSAVSLLGDGLHLISGCNHYHAQAHCCAEHGHCGKHHDEPGEAEVGNSDANCPICQFLAIPQALTPPLVVVSCGTRFEPIVAAVSLRPSLEIASPYAARAPPASLSA